MSVGGGSSTSVSDSYSGSQSQSSSSSWSQDQADSFIDPTQQAFLSNLWNVGSQFTSPQATSDAANQAGWASVPGLTSGINSLTGIMDSSAQIAAQEQSLSAGLSSLFADELMPQIQSDALAAGGFGGGRQGVAEGEAVGQIADAYTAGLGDIHASANANAVAAGQTMPGMVSSLFDAYTAPTVAGLDALSRLASILGTPTVLSSSAGESGSETQSTSESGSGSTTEQEGWDFEFGLW